MSNRVKTVILLFVCHLHVHCLFFTKSGMMHRNINIPLNFLCLYVIKLCSVKFVSNVHVQNVVGTCKRVVCFMIGCLVA